MTPAENSIPYGYCRCCDQAIAFDKITVPIPDDPAVRHIPLDMGQYAIVDAEDFLGLSKRKWFACWSKTSRTFYARTAAIRLTKKHGHQNADLMHRVILGVTDPKILVDHENHQGLDCRKDNLRLCGAHHNAANMRSGGNASGFKGVYAYTCGGTKPWCASIGFNYKQIHIGLYVEKEEAARAYDRKAIELFGKFAHLNFPLSDHEDLLTTRT